MLNRKVILLFIATIIFACGVILWYFFKADKAANPSIATPVNPFGQAESRPQGEFIQRNITPTRTSDVENERIPASERVLIQVWDKPVGGYAFATREIIVEGTSTPPTSTSTPRQAPKPIKKTVEYLLFVDRITGHIYGYNKESAAPFQITNTTIPGVYDAYILQNGTKVFMRYAYGDTIKTITANIPSFIEGADPRPLTGQQTLPDNVSSFAVSASGNAYSYLLPNLSGSSVYSFNSKGTVSVSSSPLKEWTLTYGGETAYMFNKPAAYLEGSVFSLPTKEYIVGGKTGLMALPNPQGDRTLASMWSSSGLATFISSKKTGLSVLEFRTLASKCVWMDSVQLLCGIPSSVPSGSEGLPDDWFQGTVSFSDDVYLVNADSGAVTGLLNLAETPGNPFDLIKPHINKTNSSFVFTNKEDGSLWLVNMNNLISSP